VREKLFFELRCLILEIMSLLMTLKEEIFMKVISVLKHVVSSQSFAQYPTKNFTVENVSIPF